MNGGRLSSVRSYPGLGMVATAAATLYVVYVGYAMSHKSYDVWGALILAPVLAAVMIPFITRRARLDGDTATARLLHWAMLYKLLGTFARYFMVQVIYHGSADSTQYYGAGGRLASQFRHFDFTYQGKIVGTGFMEILSGIVFAVIGVTKFGGFLFFSALSFVGIYLLYRAFCLACPSGDRRRYGRLLFFFPSLAFWPSSIGKEAWMLFTLGLASYGVALLLTRGMVGMPALLAGLAGSAIVRPHLTLIAFLGLAGAYLVRRPPRPSVLAPITRVAGIIVLVVGGLLVVTRVESFFKVDAFDTSSVTSALAHTTERTSGETDTGTFQAARANNPAQYPAAFVTVMFRPFPWEAGNIQAILASGEGLLLAILFVRSRRRLIALHRSASRIPYVMYGALFVVLFAFAFSSVGNFGILARQRVQVLPFLFIVFAAPALAKRTKVQGSPPREPPVYWALPGGSGHPTQPL